MFFDNKPYTFDRVVRIGISAGLLWGLVWVLGYLSDVLIPFAVALLLAYLINPLVISVQKKIRSHILAVLLSLSAVFALAALLAWLLIPMIINEIACMGQILFELVNNSDFAEKAAKRLPPDLWQAIKDYAAKKEVQEFFRTDNFRTIAESVARKVLPGIWGLIAGTASFFMGLVGISVIGLYLVFLLLDYQKIREGWKELLPPAYSTVITNFVADFDSAMNRHFRAQATVASIVGILFAAGFWVIGLPMGILLGFFIGLLNMVPYLQIIGLIPAFVK